jgi:hypothetical protein
MTFLWLVVWLLSSTPDVSFAHGNGWAISLGICAFLDIVGSREATK